MYGLRFRCNVLQLGTLFDWFVPDQDMPDTPNERGYKVFQDVHTTPSGNTFIYDKSRVRSWKLTFDNVSTLSKDRIEHIVTGWLGQQKVTSVYFGTSVIGTTESCGSMASAGQLFGTGFFTFTKLPSEGDLADMWNFEIQFTEFGPNQVFS
jgi:hypothetical protein